MTKSNQYITNINRLLKDVKYDVLANFIYTDNKRIIITTNKVVANSDLKIIENYIKDVDKVNISKVMSLRLPQFKFYFKILNILYYIKDTNLPITLDIIEKIIQTVHIFNNIILMSQSYIIKVSPKSKISII